MILYYAKLPVLFQLSYLHYLQKKCFKYISGILSLIASHNERL